MTATLVLKILAVTLAVACVGSAWAEWGPQRQRYPWQRPRFRREPTVNHFLINWLVTWVAMSFLVLFVIWYMR
jgi:ABC-type uncharacterized transport system permease subunit